MLPISSYEEVIVKAVQEHAFTIICAETGSGKSTQVPQYLSKHYSKVIVTEPRIMAAKTLAKRVSDETSTTLGEEVGYRTGYDKCYSKSSKILYCTDGFQLVNTIFNEDCETEKVLIIDEVHTWNIAIETLVAYCKFMKDTWNTKVVIMSATMETEKLADFFGKDITKVVNVPGKLFDVEVEERSEYDFIDTIKESINSSKNVLVFVSGKKEINYVIEELKGENATLLPLHAELDWEEQKKCFMEYCNSKVIVSTNVAQTSLTIPDIDVVVDSGKEKISTESDGIQGLTEVDISLADIAQRKGRAGRTKNGRYILCSNTPMKYREEYSVPEIQRSILDKVVLQLTTIGLDAEKLEFFHQPSKNSISAAKMTLSKLGAIDESGNITEIGEKMAKIPVSARLSRMIVEAEKYEATEQVIIISAIVEMGGLLKRKVPYSNFTTENTSDILAELDVWNFIKKKGYINFEEYGINKKNFFKITEHIKKLREAIGGVVELKATEDRKAILMSCLTGYVSSIFVRDNWDGNYYGEDGNRSKLNNNSCIRFKEPKFIVGTAIRLEDFQLINFATEVNGEDLLGILPASKIKESSETSYDAQQDAVQIVTSYSFGSYELKREVRVDYNHPDFERLKAEYNEERSRWSRYSLYNERPLVHIDGKSFEVCNSYYNRGRRYITIDEDTLFTTEMKKVTMADGETIWLTTPYIRGEKGTIAELRNAIINQKVINARKYKKKMFNGIKIKTAEDVINNLGNIGKVIIDIYMDRYGIAPVYTFGYMKLDNSTVTLDITDDEEVARDSTKQALYYVFMDTVGKQYGDSKFSHTPGKKKKVLTAEETEVKKDFDSLVRELAEGLTVSNIGESMEFVKEYYEELMIA